MRDPKTTARAKRLRAASTVAERLLWDALRGSKLNGWKFRRQAPIPPYVADFHCVALGLVVEIDGPMHDDARDRARDAALLGRGLHTLRIDERVVRESLPDALRWIDHVGRRLEAGLGPGVEDDDGPSPPTPLPRTGEGSADEPVARLRERSRGEGVSA